MIQPAAASVRQADLPSDLLPLKKALDKILEAPIVAQVDEVVSPRNLELAYEEAWQALVDGQMDDATQRFGQLAMLAPDQFRVQFGFALCLQNAGLIERAAQHYSTAYILDTSSAACAFRLGECLNLLGHREEAREALLTAIQLCEVPGTDQQIRDFAQAELDRFQ